MRRSLRSVFVVTAICAIAAYPAWPDGSLLESIWFSVVGLGCAAAMVAGAYARKVPVAPWWWLAAGIALNCLGTPVAMILTPDSWPSAGDPLYLALYPALTIGLILLIRARSSAPDWGALVDTATVSTGLGLLVWVFVIQPAAADSSLSLIARVVSIAYPIGDVVLLSVFVRLMIGPRVRTAAVAAIGSSLLLFLAGDAAWAVFNEIGWEPTPLVATLLAMLFLVAYAAPVVGVLHPSVHELTIPHAERAPTLRPVRLTVLALASLIAPAMLMLQAAEGEVTDGLAIAIGSMALFLLVVARMAQLVRHVESQARQLRDLATIDDLTGLPNRRGWNEALAAAMERARRAGEPLSVAMIDLDHFKRFNDDRGHQAGDRLLRAAAAAWKAALRTADQIARYGGEEFIVLLHDTDGEGARALLERLRPVTPLEQTFSSGVATWNSSETADELIARADRALYRAKKAGRDRTVVGVS